MNPRRDNKYMEVANDLSLTVAKMNPGDRFPTANAIKEQYNITIATASKAIKELQNRGLILSKPKLGSIVAKSFRHEFIILVQSAESTIVNQHWYLFVNGITMVCAREYSHYTVLTVAENMLETEINNLYTRDLQLAGVIIFRSSNTYKNVKNILNERNIPITFFGSSSTINNIDCPGCFYSEESIIDLAVDNFTQNGHENIGCIYQAVQPLDYARHQLFLSSMREKKLKQSAFSLNLTSTSQDWFESVLSDDSQRRAFRNFLSQVTALLVLHDSHAIALMQVLDKLGISIPDDISVISIDNLEVCNLMIPKLTSIDLCIAENASICLELLTKKRHESYLSSASLIQRKSVKILR